MNKKILGVLGGLGPSASSYFYGNIIKHTKARADQDHLDMIILSHATMPDRTGAILSGDTAEIEGHLTEDVQKLEAMGAGEIAIPCNTSHYFYDLMSSKVSVPIINMVEESVKACIEKLGGTGKIIGIMATDGTVKTGIYHEMIEKYQCVPAVPDEQIQKEVMHLIYDEIKAGETGDENRFAAIIKNLEEKGCDAIILACTELSVYNECHGVPDICVDAMEVLVKQSVLRCGGEYIQ